MNDADRIRAKRLRIQASELGLVLIRKPASGYQILRLKDGTVLAGQEFDLTSAAVELILREYREGD